MYPCRRVCPPFVRALFGCGRYTVLSNLVSRQTDFSSPEGRGFDSLRRRLKETAEREVAMSSRQTTLAGVGCQHTLTDAGRRACRCKKKTNARP